MCEIISTDAIKANGNPVPLVTDCINLDITDPSNYMTMNITGADEIAE